MTDPKEQGLRVLLPAKPKDDLGDVSRLLKAVMPSSRTHVHRLYVHRPVQADFFISDTYARANEIAQLELDAESATRIETEHEMKPLAGDGFRVSAEVVRGTPTEEILREANLSRADLIAVRTRSAAAHDRKIGGMASALLHHAPCGILAYGKVPAGYRVRRILIPTDFSRAARQSTEWGLALAQITGAKPVFLHVIAQWHNRHGIDQDELARMAGQELKRWKSSLDPIRRRSLESRVITAGNPAEGILSFARERGCDLIVLSAKGTSAVETILLGSNTRKVLRAAECPVFVVPTGIARTVEEFLEKSQGLARLETVSTDDRWKRRPARPEMVDAVPVGLLRKGGDHDGIR
jgi:nucleotide-binding universal stress UspA family protein